MTSSRRLTRQLIMEKAKIKINTGPYGTIELWRIDLAKFNHFCEIVKRDLVSISARRFAECIMQEMLIVPRSPNFPPNVSKWDDEFLCEVASEWIKQSKENLTNTSINFDLFKHYVLQIIYENDSQMTAAFINLIPKFLELSERMDNFRLGSIVLNNYGYGHTMEMWTPDVFADFARKSPNEPELTNIMLNFTKQKWFQDQLLTNIRDNSVISRRAQIIEKALDAHSKRDYLISVPLFLTQIEGIFGDYLIHRELLTQRYSRLYDDENKELSGIIPLINYLNSKQPDNPFKAIESALKEDKLSNNRNAILHGRNCSYGKAKLSTRVLLLLWILINIITNK